MRALEKNSRARVSYLGVRVSYSGARAGYLGARASYSGALPLMLRAVAFCVRACVKFKSSGTVYLHMCVYPYMRCIYKLLSRTFGY